MIFNQFCGLKGKGFAKFLLPELCYLKILITVKISDSVSDAVQDEVMGTQLSLRVLGDGIICLFGGALLILSPKLILIIAAAMSVGAAAYYSVKHKS